MDTREWEKGYAKLIVGLLMRFDGEDGKETAIEIEKIFSFIRELLEARTKEVVARMDHITTHVPFELDGSEKSISMMLYNLKLEGEATLKYFGIEK